ncbi:MAG: LamG-like jellyroll fold domain-containing protein [Dehalococcoidia bacterium]
MKKPSYFLVFILASMLVFIQSVTAGTPAGAPGLAGYYMLDEGTGLTAADSSGSGNHGTLSGPPQWGSGQFGKALDFDGVDDAVIVNNSSSLNNLDQFSLSMWFFADSVGPNGFANFLVKDDSFKLRFSTPPYHIYFSASRWNGTDGQWRFHTLNNDSFLGAWHHLTVTYDYSSLANHPVAYLDGEKIFTDEMITPAGTLSPSTDSLIIGNRASQNQAFDGRLDEVRIFDRQLTREEALQLALANADASAPSTPLSLSATANGQAINLSWNSATDGESGIYRYDIYRNDSGGPNKSLIASVPATDTSYLDLATAPGMTYFYQVSAVNNSLLEGNKSSEVDASTTDSPPTAPARPEPRSVGDGQIVLEWPSNPEEDIAGFNLFRSTNSGGPYIQLNGSPLPANTFIDAGLLNGTPHYYVLRAEDNAGLESPNSIELSVTPNDNITFAVIGDYGDAVKPAVGQVANLLSSFSPDFVVTTGDNNYPDGLASTIDANIGQFYQEFIYPYLGSYGPGADINRFFPSLGNHDYYAPNAQPYLDYFTLPGNERYYDFVWGPAHFFVLNTDPGEPDGGTDSTGIMGQWLQNGLANSTSPFKFVVSPAPPYSSGKHGSKTAMQWPFKEWGADALLTGNDHIYERIIVDDLPYFVVGLGGRSLYSFSTTVAGSVVKYNEDFGTLVVQVSPTETTFTFVNVNGTTIDNFTILNEAPPPADPTGLSADGAIGRIDLLWNANSETDLVGYNVFRSQTTGGPYQKLNTTGPVVNNSFIDFSIIGGNTYFYAVTAENQSGMESGYSNQASATALMDNGPVALWKLDDGAGNTAADSSGNNQPGTLINSPQWVPGHSGTGLEFATPSQQTVRVDDAPGLNFGSASFSIVAWIKFSSSSDTDVLRKGSTSTASDWYKLEVTKDSHRFRFNLNTSSVSSTSLDTAQGYNDGQWHHIAAIRDVEGGRMRIYVDGVEVASRSNPAGSVTNSANLAIGSKDTLDDDFFNGILDEVALYDRALSPEEVSALFEPNQPPPDASAPSVPSGLTAAATLSDVDLDWNAANDPESGISSYNIYRDTQSGGSKVLIASVGGSVLSFTDSPPVPGVPYFYQVSAVNGVGLQGNKSNEASATTADAPPAAPTGLSASGGDGTVNLDWTDNSEGDLAGYNVYRASSSGGPYQLALGGGLVSASAFSDSNVTNGNTYFYVVTAEDNGGAESGNSSVVSATPAAPAPPVGGDYVARWTFDEGSGSTASDSSSNGLHGTLINGPTWVPGISGTGLNYDRDLEQTVLVNDGPALHFGSGGFSLVAWVAYTDATDSDILRKGSTASGADWYKLEIINSTQTFRFDINTSEKLTTAVVSPGSYNDGQWHHVAGVRDVEGGQLRLYVDGQLVDTEVDPGGSTDNPSNLAIGSKDTLNDDFMHGSLDEVAIYDRALTAQEVLDLYNNPGSDPSNNPPVALNDAYNVDEDSSLSVTSASGVLFNDTDQDGDPLTALLATGPSSGILALNANGSFTYTPDADFSGSDSFTYQANDGGANSYLATVGLTVNPINDAPVAHDQDVVTVEDLPVALALAGSDVDAGASLSFTVLSSPGNGTLQGSAPNLTYTPDPGYFGPDSFTFKANDGFLDSNPATVSITVTQHNDPPIADDQAVVVDEDVSVGITLTATDPDAQPLPLTYSVVAGPSNGALSGSAPNLTYTPDPDYYGDVSFTFRANDGQDDSNIATLDITVNPVNDAPVAYNQGAATDEDTPVNITLTGADIDSQTLTFSVVQGPANGTLSGSAPNLTYTPDTRFSGDDSFTFWANDGALNSNVATVGITVNPAVSTLLYFSMKDNDTINGGLSVRTEDIVAFDGNQTSMFFDGSDVGIGGYKIDAFTVISPSEILISFSSKEELPGISSDVDDSDIVLFTATSLGSNTSGSFSLYFDGSDVSLTRRGEDVDAIELLPDGRMLLSTTGSVAVSGLSARDEDLIVFTPTSLGSNTSGSFAMYFDGSDVGLTDGGEDMAGVAVSATGEIYFTTNGSFSASGVSGRGEDVYRFTPNSLGSFTQGTLHSSPFFDGSAWGVGNIRGLDLPD